MFGVMDPTTEMALFIGAMSGLTMILIAAAFAGGASRRFNRRLQEGATEKASTQRHGNDPVRSLTRRSSSTPGIDRYFSMVARREALIERLSQTGREISVRQYMLAAHWSNSLRGPPV